MDTDYNDESVVAGLSALSLVARTLIQDSHLPIKDNISSDRNTYLFSSPSSSSSSTTTESSGGTRTKASMTPTDNTVSITNKKEISYVIDTVDKHMEALLPAAVQIAFRQHWSTVIEKSSAVENRVVTTTTTVPHLNSMTNLVPPPESKPVKVPDSDQNVINDKTTCLQTIDRSSISTAEYLRLCKLSSVPTTVLETKIVEKIFNNSVRYPTPLSSSSSVLFHPHRNHIPSFASSPSDSESEDPLPTNNSNDDKVVTKEDTIYRYYMTNTINPLVLSSTMNNNNNNWGVPSLWSRTGNEVSAESTEVSNTVRSSINVSILIMNGYGIGILDTMDEFSIPSTHRTSKQIFSTLSPFPADITIETFPLQLTAESPAQLNTNALSSMVQITANAHSGYNRPVMEAVESKMATKYFVNYSQLLTSEIEHGKQKIRAVTNKESASTTLSSSLVNLKLETIANSLSPVILRRRYLVPLVNEGHTLCFVLPSILAQLSHLQIKVYVWDNKFQGIHNIICPSHSLQYTSISNDPNRNHMHLDIHGIDRFSKDTNNNKFCSCTYDRGYIPLVLLIEPMNISYEWKSLSTDAGTVPSGFLSILEYIIDHSKRILYPSSVKNSTIVTSSLPSNSSESLPLESSASDTDSVTLSSKSLPRHIAVVMDGNGRWAQSRGLKRSAGHRAGVNTIHELIRSCRRLRIPYLTLYAFSAQNWTRPEEEVRVLMTLLAEFVATDLQELCANGVRLIVNGDINKLPSPARSGLLRMISASRFNTGLTLCLALSYGGREEIVGGVTAACRAAVAGLLDPNTLTPETFRDFLPHSDIPDPDLLIRTSGELRVSNFLLWQIAYTELYVTPTLWPDFDETELTKALLSYANRERRFGKTSAQVQEETFMDRSRGTKVSSLENTVVPKHRNMDKAETMAMVEQAVTSIAAIDKFTNMSSDHCSTTNDKYGTKNERDNEETEEVDEFVTLYRRNDQNRKSRNYSPEDNKGTVWMTIQKWYTMLSYYLLGTTLRDAFYQMLNSDDSIENVNGMDNNTTGISLGLPIRNNTVMDNTTAEEQLHRKLHRKSIRQRLSLTFLIGLVISLSIFAVIIMRKVTMNTWTPPSSPSFSSNPSAPTVHLMSTLYADELEMDYHPWEPNLEKLSTDEGIMLTMAVGVTNEGEVDATDEIENIFHTGDANSPWPWPATAHPPKLK